ACRGAGPSRHTCGPSSASRGITAVLLLRREPPDALAAGGDQEHVRFAFVVVLPPLGILSGERLVLVLVRIGRRPSACLAPRIPLRALSVLSATCAPRAERVLPLLPAERRPLPH